MVRASRQALTEPTATRAAASERKRDQRAHVEAPSDGWLRLGLEAARSDRVRRARRGLGCRALAHVGRRSAGSCALTRGLPARDAVTPVVRVVRGASGSAIGTTTTPAQPSGEPPYRDCPVRRPFDPAFRRHDRAESSCAVVLVATCCRRHRRARAPSSAEMKPANRESRATTEWLLGESHRRRCSRASSA